MNHETVSKAAADDSSTRQITLTMSKARRRVLDLVSGMLLAMTNSAVTDCALKRVKNRAIVRAELR
jgi:hypothetical protein